MREAEVRAEFSRDAAHEDAREAADLAAILREEGRDPSVTSRLATAFDRSGETQTARHVWPRCAGRVACQKPTAFVTVIGAPTVCQDAVLVGFSCSNTTWSAPFGVKRTMPQKLPV